MDNIIARGAEAIIIKKDDSIIKNRIKKNYRIAELDSELREKRTRSEAKILTKLKDFTPKVIFVGKETIEMEFIEGDVVKTVLDDDVLIAKKIGDITAKMHDLNIVHGDLTTSNMILDSQKNVKLIDFGLSFVSVKVEDKAVDLHLFKEAIESKHFAHEKEIWSEFLKEYNPKDKDQIIKRLELVEKRGRNKQKY
ncbi:MAG: KEOPS complex kinase/ATPase Bud32 [Candidatus Woesearchaeota archaeon]|jgi:Kae1-associated kinase Bud32